MKIFLRERKKMVNDTISDILTRIRNANLIKSQTVSIPLTRISKQIVEILEKQGFIESFQIFPFPLNSTSSSLENNQPQTTESKDKHNKLNQSISRGGITLYLKYQGREKKPCITNLKRISKPGLRIYANHKEIPKVLGGMGIAILSTSKGIMTDREARFYGVGGEILCSIW
jgi:small subunit ribosomal protein S8